MDRFALVCWYGQVTPHMEAFNATGLGEMRRFVYDCPTGDDAKAFLKGLKDYDPKAIFFAGPYVGDAFPSREVLGAMRDIAPVINLLTDSGQGGRDDIGAVFKREGYFSAQVAIDGVKSDAADMVTLTPVDIRYYSQPVEKDVACGFSGTDAPYPVHIRNIKQVHPRHAALAHFTGEVHLLTGNYEDHANFLLRCVRSVNFSWCPGGDRWPLRHHVKGRVLESGWARCALFETAQSPIGGWFPKDCYRLFETPEELTRLAREMPDDEAKDMGDRMHHHLIMHYHPKDIYKAILGTVL